MIEPIRDLLFSPHQGETVDIDQRWGRVLSTQLQAAELEVTVDLVDIPTTFEKLLSMRIGDVIPINLGEYVTAKVDSVPVMECGYGIFNGRTRYA